MPAKGWLWLSDDYVYGGDDDNCNIFDSGKPLAPLGTQNRQQTCLWWGRESHCSTSVMWFANQLANIAICILQHAICNTLCMIFQCNCQTYDSLFISDKIKRHLLELFLSARHLLQGAESVLVSTLKKICIGIHLLKRKKKTKKKKKKNTFFPTSVIKPHSPSNSERHL